MFKILLATAIFAIVTVPSFANDEKSFKANPIVCEVCTLVLTGAKTLIANNKTDDQVIAFIEKNLCARLGAENATCVQFMETNGRAIIADLQHMDPAAVCKKFSFCATVTKSIEVPTPRLIKSALTCEICTLVLTGAKTLLANNKSEAEVIKFIEKNLCAHLGSQNATCVNFMETEGAQILADLVKTDPGTVCKKIGLCSTSKVLVLPSLSTVNCTICKLVMSAVQTQLRNNVSEAQILHFIENTICNITGKLSAVCRAVVDGYGYKILQLVANDTDPEKICEFIGMCTNKSLIHSEIPKTFSFPTVNADPVVCTICQYVVEFLDTQLKNNKTEAAVVHALANVCNVAPSSLRDKCNSLVNEYGIYLVQLLIEFADPLKVCQVAKLC